jgi:peptidoglycan/xylan/chitin deacetylase (PgdA/CDA1 family)
VHSDVKRHLDRTIGVAGALPRLLVRKVAPGRLRHRVPVLCYHRVCDAPPEHGDVAYYNVPPARFEKQMAALARGGWTTITAAELADCLVGGREPPTRAVVLTFDDGYRNNATLAFPILRRHGLRATFYIATQYVGSGEQFPWVRADAAIEAAGARDPDIWEPIHWHELEAMAAAGMEIASHSHSHPDFGELTTQEMDAELTASLAALREHGMEARTFCASFGVQGEAAERLRTRLVTHGQQIAFLGRFGSLRGGEELLDLPRLTVFEWDDEAGFRRKLDGSHDWLVTALPLWRRARLALRRVRRRTRRRARRR